MKTLSVIACTFILSGCVVADMDSSNYDYVPWIQVFQKPQASGLTNVSQRKADLYACGVNPHADLDNGSWSLNGKMAQETEEQFNTRRDNILSCMEEKGYKVDGFSN